MGIMINNFLRLIEKALNRYIRLDPETYKHCIALENKVVCVDELILDMHFYLLFTRDGIRLQTFSPGKVDTTLQGSFFSLTRLAFNASKQNAPINIKEVTISGDIELGQEVNRLLSNVNIDWEEQLSKLTGDVIAHQVGTAFRCVKSFARRTVTSLSQDVTEYLQEEVNYLPPRLAVNDFIHDVEELRDSVERMEASLYNFTKEQA
jgi:ubiquinone biosynthesis accessory factor UbiJ